MPSENQAHSPELPGIKTSELRDLEATAFRRLLEHLRAEPSIENIELMERAGFCRNCLAKWLREAAQARDLPLCDPDARHYVYGMPYALWKATHQSTPQAQSVSQAPSAPQAPSVSQAPSAPQAGISASAREESEK